MKAYAFGLIGIDSKQQCSSSLAFFGGTMLADQTISCAAYRENVKDFRSAFVYEFPSLQQANEWYQSSLGGTLQVFDNKDPMVILEGEEFGSD